jgi:hypothetical protein
MNEFVIVLAGAAGAFLTKLVDWIFNKKSNLEDVKAKAIDNEIKLSETYKGMLDDLKPRYNDMLKEFEETVKAKEKIQLAKEKLLKEEVALLRKENKMLKQQLIEKDNIIKGFKNGGS